MKRLYFIWDGKKEQAEIKDHLVKRKSESTSDREKEKSQSIREEYRTTRGSQEIDNIKKEHWERFTKDLEFYLYGAQKR